MRVNEPVGVVGVACPDEYPLLAFVSLFAAAVVRGNTLIIIPSETHPLSATDLYQVLHPDPCTLNLGLWYPSPVPDMCTLTLGLYQICVL